MAIRYSRVMADRMPIVGGNWKMNTDLASAVELADDVVATTIIWIRARKI